MHGKFVNSCLTELYKIIPFSKCQNKPNFIREGIQGENLSIFDIYLFLVINVVSIVCMCQCPT